MNPRLVEVTVTYKWTKDGKTTSGSSNIIINRNLTREQAESVVINYLERRHPGATIQIVNMEWL